MRLYIEGYIKQKDAARRMGLSTRQVRRLAKKISVAWEECADPRKSWRSE